MRVVVAEDSVLLRAGLVQLLTSAGHTVVGEAGNAAELLSLVDDERPDVVLVDIRMPPTHSLEGLEAARALRARKDGGPGIVLLSQHIETRHATELLSGGTAGIGYLLKDRVLQPAELVDAVLRVANGGSALDPLVVESQPAAQEAGELAAPEPHRARTRGAVGHGRGSVEPLHRAAAIHQREDRRGLHGWDLQQALAGA